MLSSTSRVALALMLDWLKTTLLTTDRIYTCQALLAPIKMAQGREGEEAYLATATSCSAAMFQSLPPELLHIITTYLPSSSLIALKLASKPLFHATRSPPPGWTKTATSCEKKAARRYMSERRRDDKGMLRRRCVTCGLTATAATSFPSDFPICSAHDQWFLSTTTPSFAEDALRRRLARLSASRSRVSASPRWIAVDRVYCVHTRDIVGWHVDDCRCECASCGHFPVKCYIRIPGASSSGNPKYVELAEDKKSVLEESWMHEPGGQLQVSQHSVPIVSLEDT